MKTKTLFAGMTAGFILVYFLGIYYMRSNKTVHVEIKNEIVVTTNQRESVVEVEDFIVEDDEDLLPLIPAKLDSFENLGNETELVEVVQSGVCSASFGIGQNAESNLNMMDIYDLLKFDDPNGGAWKQGWDIQIDSNRFTDDNKLKIFVVPHSHNDPGWLKTFERYFEDETKDILNLMLENLSGNPNLKFIWAEISYFNLWWNGLSEEQKNGVKKIVDNGQLEFVTGGWVMPDESSSHFYSVITQLIEGHQWLYHHLGYQPKSAYANDPFGYSPTMAYILGRAGLDNMLIQRTHYSVKKHLAQIQELEFKWRQTWDSEGKTDILCHMMPFFFYDIPHTCGPDPKICCQFDFDRLRDVSQIACPWGAPPSPIVAKNVHERANTLLDQYRKKAMLYKTNVLLVPLGDDFRWGKQAEWTAQVTNYEKLFDYINSQPDMHAEIKFATLGDYFKALAYEVESDRFSASVLTGDFFTYADREDNYWSGYFTSRPFHKAMDRELIANLRSAQIVFSLMSAEISRNFPNGLQLPFIRSLLGDLIVARRHLSLFQHHDGIAGTAKDHVMVDYANMLFDGLKRSGNVMQQSVYVLTRLKSLDFQPDTITSEAQFYEPAFSIDDGRREYNEPVLIQIDQSSPTRLIAVFNPITQKRAQLIDVHVSTSQVSVFDMNDVKLDFEIFPIFDGKSKVEAGRFQLSILVELEPLAVKNVKIILNAEPDEATNFPTIHVRNMSPNEIHSEVIKAENINDNSKPIIISNDHLTANFNENGFAESLKINGIEQPFKVGVFKYGAAHRHETSGLYLFIPDGQAKQIVQEKPSIRIVEGRLMSYVEVWLEQVKHRVTLYNHPGLDKYSIEVTNTVDVRNKKNFELMMRFETGIKSGNISYTDLNGFQMIRRKRLDKLPLQAHYYPMPTSTFIEDSDLRMTVLSKQPLGAASLSSGQIEVMLDRRLNQDDNRGVGQGCMDNVETRSTFMILFETPSCKDPHSETKPPMHSLSAHVTLHSLLNPPVAMISSASLEIPIANLETDNEPSQETSALHQDYRSAAIGTDKLPCDIQIVDMPMLPSYENSLDDHSYTVASEVGLLAHRLGFDGRFLGKNTPISEECSIKDDQLGQLSMVDITGDLFQPELESMSLSFTDKPTSLVDHEFGDDASKSLKPMQIYAYLLKFQTFA